MGMEWPDDDEPTEEEWAALRKRLLCWHEWPEGADETEVGCVKCGYKALKVIDPRSPEGLDILQQFLRTKPEDYVHLVAPVPLSEMADDDETDS